MQHDRATTPCRLQCLRLLAGGCLLLYSFAATPIIPTAVALLAQLDRSHHVAIRQTAYGPQVVLRHDCINTTAHRHGIVAQTLTLFARQTAVSDVDHVIQFCRVTGNALQAPVLAIGPPDQTPRAEACPACEDWSCASCRMPPLPAIFPRPPPNADGLLLNVRSTVLLL